MKNYKEEAFTKTLKDFRSYESEINKLWGGRKRLFKCVDVNLEIKFCKAEMIFEEALIDNNLNIKIQRVEMMYRAYTALINKAKENGHQELNVEYRCYQFDKNRIAIVCDLDIELPTLKAKYGKDKDVLLWSVQELMRFVSPAHMNIKTALKQNNINSTFSRVEYK